MVADDARYADGAASRSYVRDASAAGATGAVDVLRRHANGAAGRPSVRDGSAAVLDDNGHDDDDGAGPRGPAGGQYVGDQHGRTLKSEKCDGPQRNYSSYSPSEQPDAMNSRPSIMCMS